MKVLEGYIALVINGDMEVQEVDSVSEVCCFPGKRLSGVYVFLEIVLDCLYGLVVLCCFLVWVYHPGLFVDEAAEEGGVCFEFWNQFFFHEVP